MADQSYCDLLNEGVSLNDVDFSWGETQPLNQPAPPVKASTKKGNKLSVKKGKNFSTHEDLVLCDAYLEITQDPIIGTEQRGTSYWKRIYDYFLAHIGEESDRNQNSIQHRWAHINEHVSKFCGALAQIEKRNKSGTTQVDKMKNALIKYREDEGNKAFGLMHCYEKLEDQEKWKNREANKKQKKTSNSTPGSSTPSANASRFEDEATSPNKDVSVTRPIGKKAAKALRAKGSSSTGDSAVMETLGNLFSSRREEALTREAKRQERFNISIAREKEIEEQRLEEERKNRAIKEQHLALEQEKVRLKTVAQDREIMSMDITGMDEQQQQYYKLLRSQIIARNSSI
ncbi:hypothetical protein ACQ4PT_041940 [Festuca glaucescens]